MKLRHPWLINTAAWTGSWVVRAWMRTLRINYQPLGPNFDPHQTSPGDHYIYAFWHENLLLPAYCYGRSDVYVLISQHADGQLIAEICRHLGFRTVRGSTTRGGVEAVRQLLRVGRAGHLGITPDGPRGPRRRVQPGLIYLAARTGLPIVPTGIGFKRPWRMRSWDAFAVPRPWSKATCVTTEAFCVPAGAEKDELEHHRQLVEDALHGNTEMAQRWADSGRWPVWERESAERRARSAERMTGSAHACCALCAPALSRSRDFGVASIVKVAIVPAPLPTTEREQEPLDVIPVSNTWVRGSLLGIALGLMAVFAIARWINPYDADGQPRRMETHTQIGLPPCTFKRMFGIPCPSCGMTTSFALLMHGDPWNSLRANAVGTLLAAFLLALIPWNLACAIRGRTLFIQSLERALTVVVTVFLVLMLARWLIVLALAWGN